MGAAVYDAEELKKMQALPLEQKLILTKQRIKEWYEYFDGNVYVSFSGGKDSTVLLDIVRHMYPDVEAVFSNTGLEYPEIQKFVKSKDNVTILTPKMRFDQVIMKYGYPLISKEVGEAIMYSRRITNAVRERERERAYSSPQASGTERQSGLSCSNSPPCNFIDTSSQRTRRTALSGKLTSGVDEGIKKSQFNKEKWLPLARDLPARVSHQCCYVMKKTPIHSYQAKAKKYPYLATLAEESRMRKQAWLKHGCNSFDSTTISSQPMSFWTEQDVLAYIVLNDIEIAPVYGDIVVMAEDGCSYSATEMSAKCGQLMCSGCQRTGCIFCAFGFHLERGKTRFQLLAETHPRQYEYAIRGGQWTDNPDYDPSAPEFDGEWKNWNPKKIWTPSKEGLGMGKIFDMCNEIYGKDFYRYE